MAHGTGAAPRYFGKSEKCTFTHPSGGDAEQPSRQNLPIRDDDDHLWRERANERLDFLIRLQFLRLIDGEAMGLRDLFHRWRREHLMSSDRPIRLREDGDDLMP